MKRESSEETKRKLIDAAYEMIVENGLEKINVRELSKRAGYSSTALYKHFESVEYLLVLSSLRFLDDYVKDLNALNHLSEEPVEMDIESWKCFNKYAFANPPVFLNLFWGKYNTKLEVALQEYFELYPLEAAMKAVAMLCCPLFVGNIEEREYMWMRRAAAKGLMEYDDAAYISKVNCLVVRSMLMEHYSDYKDEKIAARAAAECSELIEKTIRDRLL